MKRVDNPPKVSLIPFPFNSRWITNWTFIILAVFLVQCTGTHRAKKIADKIVQGNVTMPITALGEEAFDLHYIGCGGFLIEREQSAILIDPFFSNLGPMLFLNFKKLRPKTDRINQFFQSHFKQKKDADGKIKLLLTGHAHYDHIADIPTIFKNNLNQDSTQIICSQTTENLLHGAAISNQTLPHSVRSVNDIAWKEGRPITWLYSRDSSFRILPIITDHAPHFWGIKFLSSKSITRPAKKFPCKAHKMPEGISLNYVIDFLNKKKAITYRIFSHASASSNDKTGLPPASILEKKKVDLLLLCVASYKQVDNYPETIVNLTKPKHIVLNHWENFFRKPAKLEKKPATVPATKVRSFLKDLDSIIKTNQLTTSYTLPNINTLMKFSAKE